MHRIVVFPIYFRSWNTIERNCRWSSIRNRCESNRVRNLFFFFLSMLLRHSTVILVLFSRWNFVYAWTNGSYQDEQQAYAAGYLEIRSDPLITMQYKNTMSGNVPCHQRKIVLPTCKTEHHVILGIQVSAQTVQLQTARGYRNFWLPILTSWKRKLFRRGRRILSGTRCVFLLFVSFPQTFEKFF